MTKDKFLLTYVNKLYSMETVRKQLLFLISGQLNHNVDKISWPREIGLVAVFVCANISLSLSIQDCAFIVLCFFQN